MNKRALLVGTSYGAAPLLMALKSFGFSVAVCGARPDEPCVALADTYHAIDYSDRNALLRLVSEQRYAFICPSCNDYAYMAAAYVAECLGLPGFDRLETATLLHDKARFRDFAATSGLPSPAAVTVRDGADAATSRLHPPLLVKPSDSFSGRGVSRVANLSRLPKAIAEAMRETRLGTVVVEEFIVGTLHSHSAFVASGRIIEDFFVDEFCEIYPYQVDCSNHPSRLPETVRDEVRCAIATLADRLALADGLLHTQFISGPRGIFLIECMRRCPGDLYYHLVEFSTAARYIENYVAPFVGRPMRASATDVGTAWARHTISFPNDTVFWSFAHAIPAREIRVFPLCESASLVRAAPYGKAAILFARFDTSAEAFAVTQHLRDHLTLFASEPSHDPA
jgi:hypothetical protein